MEQRAPQLRGQMDQRLPVAEFLARSWHRYYQFECNCRRSTFIFGVGVEFLSQGSSTIANGSGDPLMSAASGSGAPQISAAFLPRASQLSVGNDHGFILFTSLYWYHCFMYKSTNAHMFYAHNIINTVLLQHVSTLKRPSSDSATDTFHSQINKMCTRCKSFTFYILLILLRKIYQSYSLKMALWGSKHFWVTNCW